MEQAESVRILRTTYTETSLDAELVQCRSMRAWQHLVKRTEYCSDYMQRSKAILHSRNSAFPTVYSGKARGTNRGDTTDLRLMTSTCYTSAEPGPVTPTERLNLIPAITTAPWLDGFDLSLPELYWRKNLGAICKGIWPTNNGANMDKHLVDIQSFWISLPEGATTKAIPRPVLDYWRQKYAHKLFGLFPHAEVLAASKKAQDRLRRLGIDFVGCGAVTKPGCNFKDIKDSWPRTGKLISELLKQDDG
jgi:hypothetical protein